MNIPFIILQFILFISPLAMFTGTRDHFLIKETILLIFVLGAILLFAVNVLERKQEFKIDKVGIAFLIFIFIEILTAFNSRFPELTLHTAVIHLCFAGSYILCASFKKNKHNFFNILLVTGFIISIYGILQYFNIDFMDWNETYGNRPSSSFGNPNFFAGYIAVTIPLAISRFLQSNNKVNRILWFLLSVLLLIDIFLTQTRGAWIALIVSCIYFLAMLKFNIKKVVLGTAILAPILIIFLIKIFFNDYTENTIAKGIPSVSERVFKWKTAWEMIKEHPFLGVGAGNLKVNYALYQAKIRNRVNIQLKGTSESNVHNEYLQVWAETGTFGLISFLLIFAFYFFQAIKRLKNAIDMEFIGITSAVIAFLIFCLSNFPLRIIPTGFTIFLFMGLACPSQQIIKNNKQLGKISGSNFLARTVFLLVYIITLWKFAIIPFIADIVRMNGDSALNNGNINRAVLQYEKAIKLDKIHSERTAYDLGEIFRKSGRYADAITAYKVSTEVRNYGEVYNCIANCYWVLNNFELAEKNWEIASRLGMPDQEDQKIVDKNLGIVKEKIKIQEDIRNGKN